MYNKFVREKKRKKNSKKKYARFVIRGSFPSPVLDPFFSVYLFDVCANGCPHIAFIVIIIIGRPAN